MYAVIETGGKQYRVQPGDVISVEKLNVEAGEEIKFLSIIISTNLQPFCLKCQDICYTLRNTLIPLGRDF